MSVAATEVPQALGTSAAPAEAALYPPHRAVAEALRALPGALRKALWSRGLLLALAAAFAAGLALSWSLQALLEPEAARSGPAPAAIGASFVLNLVTLALALMLLPASGGKGFLLLRAWLRVTAVSLAAFAGLACAPGAAVSSKTVLGLAALTSIQAAALLGTAGWLACLTEPFRGAARLLALIVLALAATGTLWSRPLLEDLYVAEQNLPHGKRGSADDVAQALLALGPSTAVAALWNEARALDLLRGRLTYEVWLGNHHIIPYPRLWPGREPDPASPLATVFKPGLALVLGMWGLALLLLADVLPFAVRPIKQDAQDG